MIVGRIADIARQKGILPAAMVRALEVLQTANPEKLEAGRYDIDGDKLFYLVQDPELRTLDESKAEAHRSYADIQIPLSASERYGFALPQPGLVPCEDQFESRDYAFFPTPANESFIDAAPGDYLVFMPGELHRPCLEIDKKGTVRKVVVKVHVSLLGL